VLSYGVWKRNQKESTSVIFYFFIAMVTLFFGYAINIHSQDSLQLKNIISLEAFLLLLLLGYLCSIGHCATFLMKSNFLIYVGLLILLAMDGVAIYEVISHRSWAFTIQTSGEMVYRASATLFNPNLFAFWSSLVYMGCAYAAHDYPDYRKFTFFGMVLAAIAIYFSGSRSAGYLLLLMLLLAWHLIGRRRRRWQPLIIYPLTMAMVYVMAKLLMPSILPKDGGWSEILLLGERFALASGYMINYSLTLFTGVEVSHLPSEIKESIDGRFNGGLPDAGWFVLFEDAGWLGVISMLFIFVKLFPPKFWLKNRSPAGVYGLAIFCFCFASGFTMRFQIFPVWVFIGVVLVQSLALRAREQESNPANDKF
jgi:hypothetical protein